MPFQQGLKGKLQMSGLMLALLRSSARLSCRGGGQRLSCHPPMAARSCCSSAEAASAQHN